MKKQGVKSDISRYITIIGQQISERITKLDCDLIFFGDLFFHLSEMSIPVVLLSDMTFEQVDMQLKKSNEKNFESCIFYERLMLSNSSKIIYCSEWIKNKAVEFYNIDPKKIEVVEFGANIPKPVSYSIDIDMDICRLVFIGRDWEKKGGNIVLKAYEILKEGGFPCTLTIIGSTPKDKLIEDDDLTIIPYLDKAKQEDLAKLCDILSKSHFLVLPTKFDAFGIVFCEASAYGVPSIATDVGGVGQAIREGKNGFLMPPDATAEDYAEKIKSVFSDKEKYFQLRQTSRNEYETRLNWDVWGERVNRILEDAVAEWKKNKN